MRILALFGVPPGREELRECPCQSDLGRPSEMIYNLSDKCFQSRCVDDFTPPVVFYTKPSVIFGRVAHPLHPFPGSTPAGDGNFALVVDTRGRGKPGTACLLHKICKIIGFQILLIIKFWFVCPVQHSQLKLVAGED